MIGKRVRQFGVLLAVLALLASGCGQEQKPAAAPATPAAPAAPAAAKAAATPAVRQVLTVSIDGEAKLLDPHWANSGTEMPVVHQIFNGLVRFKPGTVREIEADVAESWETAKDGMTWTFKLRRGVQWQKGYGELTADDVVWSFKRAMDPEVKSPYRAELDVIQGVRAVDKYTVEFKLKRPDPFFLYKMVSYHGGSLVKKEHIEKVGKNFNQDPLGTGPFQFVEYRPQERVVLERHQGYFRGTPKLERIEFLIISDETAKEIAFKNGTVMVGRGLADKLWVERMQKEPNLIVHPLDPPFAQSVHLDLTKPPLDNLKVRQALMHALDRESYVKDYRGSFLSEIHNTPLAPSYFGFSDNVTKYEYNPAKAKQLLAEAGYPNGFSLGKQISSTVDIHKTTYEWLQEQWRKVGVRMDVELVDHAVYNGNVRKGVNSVVHFGLVRMPYADTILTETYHSAAIIGKPTAAGNYSKYSGIDDLLDGARVEMDQAKQKAMYAQALQKLSQDLPSLYIAGLKPVFVRSKKLKLDHEPKESVYYSLTFTEKTEILP